MTTDGQFSDVSIEDAVEKACWRDTEAERASYLEIIRDEFKIKSAAMWGQFPDADKDDLKAAGLPRMVIIQLDDWFQQQLVDNWERNSPSRNRKLRETDETQLICREATKKDVVDYVFDCAAGPPPEGGSTKVWSKAPAGFKCQLKCTSGVMGIGKSTVLSKVGPWVRERVAALIAAAGHAQRLPGAAGPDDIANGPVPLMLRGFKVAHVSYNGGSPKYEVPRAGDEALCFGKHLLRSHGFPERGMSKVRSLEDALRIMRAAIELDDTQLLIVTVDEIADLDTRSSGANPLALRNTVSALMNVQDASLAQQQSPVLFIFSSVLECLFPDLEAKTGSGRSVGVIALPHLHLDAAQELLFERMPGLEDAYNKSPALRQLILSCMGHPRALFEGIVENVKVKQIDTFDLAGCRKDILAMCKLHYLRNDATERDSIVRRWFAGDIDADLRQQLLVCGVLQVVDSIDFLLPLALHGWAASVLEKDDGAYWALAHHVGRAYSADCVVERTHEKKVEEVVTHYEAVRRISRAGRKGETIGSFFKQTNYIGSAWKSREITIRIPEETGDGIVEFVTDFSDAELVLRYLRSGRIVVSEKRTEQGLEYASAFFEQGDEMLVAVAQVKFQPVVKWSEAGQMLSEEVNDFTRTLKAKSIPWFPVMYTTHHAAIAPETFSNGVYFNEVTLFEFTKKLGILRTHVEKLGQKLRTRCPSLARPMPTKRQGSPDTSGTGRKGPLPES